ncbi:MAG TPA: carbamate kinase [Mycobacteriales bacterium]|nr:carbamate kinase [Mycobacteriales bacterium]
MRVVVALGGNALSPGGSTGSVEEMREALATTAVSLADLVAGGTSLVLTHGNGPQVGRLLLQQELAADEVPPMPMDVCGALSQGQLGYLVAQALDNELRRRRLSARVLSLVTQVVVAGRDPAFRRPSKPVGPSYERPKAQEIAHATGHVFTIQPDGRWRRVVASPRPVRLVEEEPLRALVESGHVVVAAGGGGVPVVEHRGQLRGVEAVVDKDRTAGLLATAVGADVLLVLTEVARVQVDFGTARAREVEQLTVGEARALLAQGQFPDGSMGPKVEACAGFAETGGRAAIGALRDATAVLAGRAGTAFVP